MSQLLASEFQPVHVYWLLSQTYHLALVLFSKALSVLQGVDEHGFYRLNQALATMAQELKAIVKRAEEKLAPESEIVFELGWRNAEQLSAVQSKLEAMRQKM